MCVVVRVHPQLAARALDDRRGLAVVVGVRVRADEQPHVLELAGRPGRARARGARASRARACPVSTSTIPSPAASAQALQCGTPGQGSGRRSRQTPGSTRSPRPTSRRRVDSATRPDASVRRMATAESRRPRRSRAEYFALDPRRPTRTRSDAAYADDATIDDPGGRSRTPRRELIAYFEELWAAFPDFRFEVPRASPRQDDGAAATLAHDRDVRRARAHRSSGFEPTGARIDRRRRRRRPTSRDGAIAPQRAYTDDIAARPAARRRPAGRRPTARCAHRTAHAHQVGAARRPRPRAEVRGVVGASRAPAESPTRSARRRRRPSSTPARGRCARRRRRRRARRPDAIVLGHGHTDHRARRRRRRAARSATPDEVVDAEGSGGWRYWDGPELRRPARSATARA